MAKFTFGKEVDIHWNGYEIVGPALTEFSIPDQLYEEFEADFRAIEPSLTWIDTNEFATLSASVPNYTIAATSPISIASSTNTAGAVTKTWSLSANYSTSTHDHSGTYQPVGTYVNAVIGTSPASVSTASGTATISISSGTALNGYILSANGSGGTIWNPASTSGLTSVVGVSPISSAVSGGVVSVSLNANYQTAGTYASSVSGTSPISATLSTAGVLSLSIDSSATSANNAARTRSLVRNSTVSTIAKGAFVYIDGSNGTVPTVQKALATTDATSARTFGIVEADISSNTNGYVTNQGLITGIDTSGFADGAVLWLSATIAGTATTTKPTGPNHGVLLGIVVKGGSVGAGEIYVFIKNGAELDEIHDVNISGLANGDTLIWSSTASVWQNQTLANAGIAASTHTHNYQASGTYVNAVIGTSPASVLTASGTSTVSIVAGAINSTHLADNAVVAAKINAGAVGTAKISSTGASNGWVLKADGAGNASFGATATVVQSYTTALSGTGTWTVPTGVKELELLVVAPGAGGGSGAAYRDAVNTQSGGSGGGGGGAGGNWLYIPRYVVQSGITSYSYSLATPGNGGAAVSASQGAAVTKTQGGTTGSAGSNASGATTFGADISLAAASGGEGGNYRTTTGTNVTASGGGGASMTQLGAALTTGTFRGSNRSGASTSNYSGTDGVNARVYNAEGTLLTVAKMLEFPYVSGYIQFSGDTASTVASSGSISTTGTTTQVTQYPGTIAVSSLSSDMGFGGQAASGGGVNEAAAQASRNAAGTQGTGQAGCGGAGWNALHNSGTVTLTVSGSTGGNGGANTGCGGGGGGGSAIFCTASVANRDASTWNVTSGAGGNGGTGLILIRYQA